MTIHDFGKMNSDDEASFVTLLVETSRDYVKAHGHPEQGPKIIALFKTAGHDGGVYKFADRLQQVDAQNKRSAINPNNREAVLQVEDAMELMLKDEGFLVPAKYLIATGKSFQPSGIPRPHSLAQ